MTNEEIDQKIKLMDELYKEFKKLCYTIEIPEDAEAEIFGAYKGERWALLMKKSKPNLDK